jgi:hypothetical protein
MTTKRDYKHEYETYQKHKVPYRVELKKNDKALGGFVGDGKDVSHGKGGKVSLEDSSKNKGRKEKSRKKGSKRKPWMFWKKKNKKKKKKTKKK